MRTKAAIVDACLELVHNGDLRPTAPRVAERAGVSVRSVFQHFADLEALFAAVGDEAVARLKTRTLEVDPTRPLEERIGAVVAHRAALLEELTPLRRSIAANASNAPIATDRLRIAHALARAELAHAFASELGDDHQLLDAVDAVLSWPTWDQLRTLIGLDEAAAASVVARIVRSLLGVDE
jgi:TetR/AcrR family transcriptional regulator of autoinduction and epiphytic fitness